jgi:hypothetical protein
MGARAKRRLVLGGGRGGFAWCWCHPVALISAAGGRKIKNSGWRGFRPALSVKRFEYARLRGDVRIGIRRRSLIFEERGAAAFGVSSRVPKSDSSC